MNSTEQDYFDSYARPEGCLAVAAAFILMVMIGSIALNILLLVKISQIQG